MNIDAFCRAVVQKDPIETAQVLNDLFGIDPSIEYYPESLREKGKTYQEVKELLALYKSSIHLLLASPVHYAAATGSLDRLKEISDLKLLNIVDQKGMTPLHYAICFKQKEAAAYLASKCRLDYRTPLGDTYLHYAAMQGDSDLLACFLALQPDASCQNRLGMTPAHLWAAVSDDLDGLKKLMDAGANLEQFSPSVPLSPIEIQILRTIEMNPDPVEDIDFKLLSLSLAQSFFAAGLWNLPVQSLWPHRLCYGGLSLLNELVKFGQQQILPSIVPSQVSFLQGMVGIPVYASGKIQSWLFESSLVENIITASSSVAVASRGFSSLSKYKYADWNTTLLAAGVHAVNLASSLFQCYLAYYQPFNFYTSLSTIDRIQDPRLLCPDEVKTAERFSCIRKCQMLLDPKADPTDIDQWTGGKIEDRVWGISRELNVRVPPENVRRAADFLLGKN